MDIETLNNYLRQETEYERSLLEENEKKSKHTEETKQTVIHDLEYLKGIIVFRQNRYEEVMEHQHDWLELIYIYSGGCHIYVEGNDIYLQEHQALMLNNNIPHSCGKCGKDDILINFLIRRNYLNTNFFNRFSDAGLLNQYFLEALMQQQNLKHYLIFKSEKSRRLPLFVQEFLCEYYERSLTSEDYLDSLATLIFLELADVFRSDMNAEQIKQKQYIFPILHYIEENHKTCTLKSTAEVFHMNPNYLSNYIKKQTGVTFKHLIQNQKLSFAAKLLKNTELPIIEVANQSGYENISFFYEKFQEKYGIKPAEYRKNNDTEA